MTENNVVPPPASPPEQPPRVCVVLPTFNGAARIMTAIESVLSQDYGNLELIVVDDASTDGTAGVVGAIGDPRVRLVSLAVNGGPAAARAAGIDASDGPLVAFIDDDDQWRPGKLRRQVELLTAQPGVALVHTAVIDVFPDGARRLRSVHRRANEYAENLCQDRIATSTVMLRRAAIEAAGGFDVSLRAYEDWDLWVRVLKAHPASSIAEPLAEISLRPGSLQRGSDEAFEANRRIVLDRRQAELKAAGLWPRAQGLHHYAVAAKLQQSGRGGEARRRAISSLRCRPSLQALLLLGLTLLPRGVAHRARLELRRGRSMLRL